MLDGKFSTSMKKAWIWLSLYILSLALLRLVSPDEPLSVKLALAVTALINPAILIYLIRLARHEGSATTVSPLNAWGYTWRGFILYFFQVPLLLLASLAVPLNLRANEFTATQLILWEVPFAAVSAIGAWLLFSTSRREQLRLLLRVLRGY